MKENAAAFARRLGVHKSNVTRAIQSGRLIRDADGLLDIAANLLRWQETKAGTRPDVSARHERARGATSPAKAPATPNLAPRPENSFSAPSDTVAAAADLSDDDNNPTEPPPGRQQHYAALRIGAQNNLLKLAIALRTHRRYPLAGIRAEALALGGSLRAALERLVDQTAPRLALLDNTADRQALIAAETNSLRRAMRSELPRALRRLRDTGNYKP